MGVSQSANIVTNGLVFSYDVSNNKSYKGPPLRNHIQTISPTSGTGDGFNLSGGSEIVDIPTLGPTTVWFSNYQNINSGGNYCCTAFMNYGNAGNIFTGSTLYTYLILYRTDSGYTHPNWMYRYEYNSSGTYQGEAGVHDTSRRTYLGNGWYYGWGTFTTQATTSQLQCYSFTYNYSSFNDKISIAKVCILQGDYSGLHPKYWPETNTTRSNTQTVIDLTGRRTITVSGSPTYGSDGTFTFNSSGSTTLNLGSGNNFLPMPSLTLESWIKTSGVGSGMTVNGIWGFTYGIRFNAYSNGSLGFIVGTNITTFVNIGTSGVNINDNNWHHVVAVKNEDSYCAIYVDGVVRASGIPVAGWDGTNIWSAMDVQVGRDQNDAPYYFNGRIDIGRVYNRALTASEVLQNFNAQRGLYGL